MTIYEQDLELKNRATFIRRQTLDLCVRGGGHLASAFSCIELLVALYYGKILHYDPADQLLKDRDRFVLSKGHAVSALYIILSDLGFFSKKELDNYNSGVCLLGSHPDKHIPGIDVTTGSLGHGLGIASGIALAAKLDNSNFKTVVLLGDGECSEGEIWESALFAAKHKLNNLVAIIDRNRLCVADFTEDCICLDPLSDKWKAFGWDVLEIDGHSFPDIIKAFDHHLSRKDQRPLMIIANTVKGKGVSFMENMPIWHTRIPAGDQLQLARKELSPEIL